MEREKLLKHLESYIFYYLNYPMTIITDRYGGTYSGGNILVFNLDYNEIPAEVSGDDVSCGEFWKNINITHPNLIVGRGSGILEAMEDFINKIGYNDKPIIKNIET